MKRLFILALMLLLVMDKLCAEIVVNIDSGIIQRPLVCIINANAGSQFSKDVNSVIVSDLNNSGKLQGKKASVDYEVKQGITWNKLKADYVALMKYVKNSHNKYTVKVKILKRNSASYIQSITYKDIDFLVTRTLGHKISNYIYKKITSEEGFFLTKLAYVKVSNPYSRYARIYELIIADYDGFNKHTVLRQSGDPIATPSWSNDGKYIIYSSYIRGNMGVYKLEISTGKTTVISNYKGINSSPSFSPDDNQVALALSKEYSDNTNIYVIDLATKALNQLTFNGTNTAPRFSPSGKNIVFTSDRDGRPNIYIAAVKSKYPRSFKLSSKMYQAYQPSYTADGKNIVFMHQKSNSDGTQIAIFNLASGNITVLTRGRFDSSPTVSPYGGMIAYTSSNSKGYNFLDVISIDGHIYFNVESTDSDKALIQSPSWSPKNFCFY